MKQNKKKFIKDINEIVTNDSKKGYYGLEITTTQACNMACKYCFENDTPVCSDKLDKNILFKRIDELLQNEWFKRTYKGIKIDFWGGEPTLNMDLIESIFDMYMPIPNVTYHIYSNGYKMYAFYNLLSQYGSKWRKKVKVQFSYDGYPIHDFLRRDKKDQPTREIVLENTDKFYELGIDVFYKSTIIPKYFRFLTDIWDDFEKLYYRYNNRSSNTFQYHPTIDYYNNYTFNFDSIFERSMLEIARKELKFYERNGEHLLSWFKGEKLECGAGKNMSAVNVDGNVYYCHGCLYMKDNDEVKITNINDDTFVQDIINNHEKVNRWNIQRPEECSNCISTQCMRCNSMKYQLSSKDNLVDKWHDYTNQPELCRYFKIFGRINRAVREVKIGGRR